MSHRSILFTIIGVLALIYFSMFIFSFNGYGYAGYRGYHHGPSFWYFGGPSFYPGQSVRGGSVGGPSSVGGGIRGGK